MTNKKNAPDINQEQTEEKNDIGCCVDLDTIVRIVNFREASVLALVGIIETIRDAEIHNISAIPVEELKQVLCKSFRKGEQKNG